MNATCLLTLLTISACTSEPTSAPSSAGSPAGGAPTAPAVATGPSLILVTLDTTRADRLGAYGYAEARTPTIDKLASEGVLFERAYATVPLTTPSHASMLTGLYPTRHGIHNNGDAILAEQRVTLAEVLQGKGYRTAASVSAFVTSRVWNLDQGFDAYFDDLPSGAGKGGGRWGQERPAEGVVDDLIGWLQSDEKQTGPFFMWAHVYDPHHPHVAPPPFDEMADPYDGEIAYVDAQLARLQAAAEAAAGPEGVHWIVIADHGEAMEREHGEVTHGLFLFDPTMRVPFIVRPAKPLSAGKRVEEVTVSGVDVTPTALALLGIDVPADLDGHDLSAALGDTLSPRDPVYMESTMAQDRFGYHAEIAMAQGPLKLMDTPDARLYDVATDPGELTNLLDKRPADVARLREAHAAVQSRSAQPALGVEPSPEVVQQLAALGYVTNDFAADPEARDIDAKTRLGTISTLESLRARRAAGEDSARIEAEYIALIAREPQLGEARMGLAKVQGARGDHAAAEKTYLGALERQPDSALLRVNLANTIAAQGRHAEGIELLETVLAQVPGDGLAQIGTLRMLTDLDRLDEAERRAKKWLKDKPNDPSLMAQYGVALLRKNEGPAAEDLLRKSLVDGVPRQLVHKGLAVIEVRKGHPKLAIHHYRVELDSFPGDGSTRHDLAMLFMKQRNWEAASGEFARVLHKQPKNPLARLGQTQALFNLEDYDLATEVLAPALRAQPDNPDILMLHANILGKTGHRDEATKVAERANKLHGERVEREKARRKENSKADGEAAAPTQTPTTQTPPPTEKGPGE
jgi:arylsulfatase A-like enzyme/predicted Zn-dependent protease